MGNKSISDLILEKFREYIESNDLFEGISADLILSVRQKRGATRIRKILEKD